MIVVGLGKVAAAERMHRRGTGQIMAGAIAEIAATSLASGKFLGGLAIVENGYEETAILEGVTVPNLVAARARPLQQANALMPHLPVDDMDVLIVEEMGKNISGTGMDVNITGRWRLPGVPDPVHPHTNAPGRAAPDPAVRGQCRRRRPRRRHHRRRSLTPWTARPPTSTP